MLEDIREVVKMFEKAGVKTNEKEVYMNCLDYIRMAKEKGLTNNQILAHENIVKYFELRIKFYDELLNDKKKFNEFSEKVFNMLVDDLRAK